MSNLSVNTITDASGGSTASINGLTPQASNMQPYNMVINGAMTVAQRGTSAVTIGTTSEVFRADRFRSEQGGSTANNGTLEVSTDAPSGFKASTKFTAGSSATYNTAGFFSINYRIEGQDVSQLSYGTASAAQCTLSFWVKASITGTYSLNFTKYDGASERFQVKNYVINSANTWEYKTITLDGDTAYTASEFMRLYWQLGGDGGAYTATPDVWFAGTGTKRGTSNQPNLVGTNGATFYITGVQLEAGSTASSFAHENYGDTLQKCQRYYYKQPSAFTQAALLDGTGDYPLAFVYHPVEMRATPTTVFESLSSFYYNNGSGGVNFIPAGGTTAYIGNGMLGVSRKNAISNSPGASHGQKSGQWSVQLSFSAEL